MGIKDIYSRRRAMAEKAGQPDVWEYGSIPDKLRGQIMHILGDALGVPTFDDTYGVDELWGYIESTLAREYGMATLADRVRNYDKCRDWFGSVHDTDHALDFIEVSFDLLPHVPKFVRQREVSLKYWGIRMSAAEAVEELNERFKQNGVGYRFEPPIIVRIDSEYAHAEIVKPTLQLLADPIFDVANKDFRDAHIAYREGRAKDCVVASQRAFESALKAICSAKGWAYSKGDRASELVKIVRANGLFPEYLDKGFDTYINMLRTGLPELRNNAGGHGASPNSGEVPSYIAAHAIHLTAANIVLLGDAYRAAKALKT